MVLRGGGDEIDTGKGVGIRGKTVVYTSQYREERPFFSFRIWKQERESSLNKGVNGGTDSLDFRSWPDAEEGINGECLKFTLL